MRSPRELPDKKGKIAIALIFATIMIFSGVGIMAFQALSQWEPSQFPIQKTPSHIIEPAQIGSSVCVKAQEEPTSTWSTTYASATIPHTYYGSGSTVPVDIKSVLGVNTCAYFYLYVNSKEVDKYHANGAFGQVEGTYTCTFDTSFNVTSNTTESFYIVDSAENPSTSDYCNVTSSTGDITAVAPPSVTVSSSGTPDATQSFTLTASPSGGSGSYTYQWYTGSSGSGSPVSGATSSTYTTSESTAGNYGFYVAVNDSLSQTVDSSTFTQTVNSDPSIAISSNLNPSDIGQSVDFSTATSGGTGSYTSYSYVLYDGPSIRDCSSPTAFRCGESYTVSGIRWILGATHCDRWIVVYGN